MRFYKTHYLWRNAYITATKSDLGIVHLLLIGSPMDGVKQQYISLHQSYYGNRVLLLAQLAVRSQELWKFLMTKTFHWLDANTRRRGIGVYKNVEGSRAFYRDESSLVRVDLNLPELLLLSVTCRPKTAHYIHCSNDGGGKVKSERRLNVWELRI